MKRFLLAALALGACALFAEAPAFDAAAALITKSKKARIEAKDGVFSAEDTVPDTFTGITFKLNDMPYRTDLRLEFEYRSKVLSGGKERYIGVTFTHATAGTTFTGLPASEEWQKGAVHLSTLKFHKAKDRRLAAGEPLKTFYIYSRRPNDAPGTVRLEVRSIRFVEAAAPSGKAKAAKAEKTAKSAGPATTPETFRPERAVTYDYKLQKGGTADGVFTAENTADSAYTHVGFKLNGMKYDPALRLVFEYRSKVLSGGAENYIAVLFSRKAAGTTFTQFAPSQEWKQGAVDFHALKFHKAGRLRGGEALDAFSIYSRRPDGEPGKVRLEVRNVRFERNAKYDPQDGVRMSYSAKPLISWRAVEGAEKYAVVCMQKDRQILSGESVRPYFVPEKPLAPGLYDFVVKALPSGKLVSAEPIIVPAPAHTWTLPKYDFAKFIAQPRPRLRKLAAYWNPDLEALTRQGKALLKLEIPPNPEPYKEGADPNIRAWIEWYGKIAGGVISRNGGKLQAAGQAAILTGDPELIANAKRLALEIARKWDPESGSSMKRGDLQAASLLRGLCWCYDAAYNDMTPEERKTVADCIRVRGDQFWSCVFPFRMNESQNHPWDRTEAAAFAALALAEEPGMAMRYDYCANVYGYRILPSLGFKGENNEGLAYWSYGFGLAMRFIDVARQAVGLSFYTHPWLKYTARFPMYGMPAGGYILSFGDNGRPNHGRIGPMNRPFTGKLAAAADDPAALWYAGYPEKDGVLAKPPTAELVPQSIAYEHLGIGIFNTFLPDGRENTALGFHSGKFFAGHQHADQNSFMINAYGDKLAIDGGYYDFYGSRHFKAYSIHTQAHNTVLVNGKGQIDRKEGADGKMTGYFDSPNFGYVSGDASSVKLYRGELDKFDRDIVFLKPDFVAVYDRLGAPNPAKFQWLLHSHSDKPIDWKDGSFSFARPLAKMAGKMFLPDGMTANVKRSYSPDDDPVLGYSVTKDPNPQPEWTLTVENSEPAKATEFFSVMQIARTGEPCAVEWKRELSDTGVAAVSKEAAVVFRRGKTGKVAAGKFETDARAAAVIFAADGSVYDAMLADGSYLKYDGKTLLDAGKKAAGLALRKEKDVKISKVDVKVGSQTVKADYRVEKFAFGREIHYVSGVAELPAGHGWRIAGGEEKAPVSVILLQGASFILSSAAENRLFFLSGGKLGFSFASAKPFGMPEIRSSGKVELKPGRMQPVKWQPPANAVKFEAEDDVKFGPNPPLIQERESASGGKATISWDHGGQSGSWRFTVPKAGKYEFLICVASTNGAISRELRLDGQPLVPGIVGINFRGTGGFGYSPQEWRWVKFPVPVPLTAGTHEVSVTVIQGSANLDALAFVPVK